MASNATRGGMVAASMAVAIAKHAHPVFPADPAGEPAKIVSALWHSDRVPGIPDSGTVGMVAITLDNGQRFIATVVETI